MVSFPGKIKTLHESDFYSSIYGNSSVQTNIQQCARNSPKCDSVKTDNTAVALFQSKAK